MRYGHFDDAAREYVITRPDTPRPWSNYLGSTTYGAIITNHAGGYSFYQSGATGRFLRLRFNAVPLDQPGRYFYLRDAETGDFWSASWQPVGKPLDQYRSVCRHGTAYTVISSEYAGIETESTYFVPVGATFEYWRLKVTNTSGRKRKLGVFTYCEFATEFSTQQDLVNLQYTLFIVQAKLEGNLLRVASNDHPGVTHPPAGERSHRCWMALVGAPIAAYDAARDAFIGVYGSYARPDALVRGRLSNTPAFGDTACGGLQVDLELDPGESRELLVLVGIGDARVEGKATLESYGTLEAATAELARLKHHWHSKLGAVTCQTPDENFDHMVNVWNAYNSLITFSWSRAASLVYNGERDGLGFRDSVQDLLGVMPMITDEAKARLELMLTGQLAHGGAMPIVKPFSHRPGHEKGPPEENLRSDDCLWFFNAVPEYVAETGDLDFYHKVLPFADHGEATVLGHLRRALEFNLTRTGRHGLPCGLEADWNDCLRLGYHGESVFVAFQVRLGLTRYAEAAARLGLPDEAAWATEQRRQLDEKIQRVCWDGDRFIWAIGEDGTVYGKRDAAEGRIYLNTQVWAILSGAATPEQARTAMATVARELKTDAGVMLCAPPFVHTSVKVMRAVLFNPGIKENAGIFNHTQAWVVIADTLLGDGDAAWADFRAYMPAAWNDRADIRQIEPYTFGQTTYSPFSPRFGVSRVPWLSGTVSWSYYTAVQYLLGFKPDLDGLRIDPCIPRAWSGFTATRRFRGKTVRLTVNNPHGVCKGVKRLTLDGHDLPDNLLPAERLRDGSVAVAELG
ncbi:MAG: GH36-type glycosyl hydrolase domain-containing protein [Tepidisphaerales bacterium]